MSVAALVLALASQVDPIRVEQAIQKGVAYLRTADSPESHAEMKESDELILLTLLHAGVASNDEKVLELLKSILERPLSRTYKVALQAMALEELDRVKYQERIWQCAQFLVDNQGRNGRWGYGKATTIGTFPAGTPTEGSREPASGVREFGAPGERVKPKVQQRVPVKKQRDGPDSGDNSCSQYAALGLRACHEAGILLPQETLEKGAAEWRRCQEREGGEKDDDDGKKKRPAVATGPTAPKPLGWDYGESGSGDPPWGSMTAGAVGALVIYDHLLGKDWKADPDVAEGLAWLAKKFTAKKNPGKDEWLYYWLYAVERVGILCGTEKIGPHAWYAAGAKQLLDTQQPDGSWKGDEQATWDTCFAILFLRRATRPLEDVPSVDRFKKR